MTTTEDKIQELIEELEKLKDSAYLRANDLTREEAMRKYSEGTSQAYGYVQLRLRQII